MQIPKVPQLARVRAWAGNHKAVLGVGAAGVVVLLAMRQRAASGDSAGAADTVDTAAAGGTSTDPQGATVGGYDSSANDIYNALQPQVEQTQSLIRKLMARIRAQRKEQRQLERQLRKAQQRARKKHTPRRRHKPVQTPPTKPRPPHKPRKLAPNRGTVSGGPQRRRASAAPRAVPTAVVTRRQTTLTQLGRASGSSFAQVAAANRGGVTPGAKIPAGTRVTLPPKGRG